MAEPFFESVGPVLPVVEPQHKDNVKESAPKESAPVAEPFFESVGPVLEQAPEVVPAVAPQESGLDGSEPVTEFAEASTTTPRSVENEILEVPEESVFAAQEANEFSEHPREEALVAYEQPNEVFASEPEYAWPGTEAAAELTAEPIENDQPHETIFAEREAFVERENFAEREAFPERESFTEREAPVSEVIAEHASDFQPPPAVPVQACLSSTNHTCNHARNYSNTTCSDSQSPGTACAQTATASAGTCSRDANLCAAYFLVRDSSDAVNAELQDGSVESPSHIEARHDAFAFTSARAISVEFAGCLRSRENPARRGRVRHHSRGSVSATAACHGRHAFVCRCRIAGRAEF